MDVQKREDGILDAYSDMKKRVEQIRYWNDLLAQTGDIPEWVSQIFAAAADGRDIVDPREVTG